MSISSSMYADYANQKKHEWVMKLISILNRDDLSCKKKIRRIQRVVTAIDKFYFSE